MSYKTMYTELMGMVPKFSITLAKSFINRAWKDVRNFNLWSFQLYDESIWITPAVIDSGTVSVIRGSANVTPDATAAAAITAGVAVYSTIPQRQFRIGAGTIYNIISWDGTTLVLDRPYGEATDASASYQILQVYYAAPYQDHVTFLTVRDMERFVDLVLDKSREWLDHMDPHRSYSCWPTHCVFYKTDPQSTSTTYQYPLYELWGMPQEESAYNLYGIRNGVDLSAPTDALPAQVGEDVVIERAKYYVYQWAEAHKSEWGVVKGGADYKFLMKEANAEYFRLARDCRKRDRERVDNWSFAQRINPSMATLQYYDTISGRARP